MKISIVKQITTKELKNNFDNFSGYLFIGIFLGLVYYLFLQTFFIAGAISLDSMFQVLPWLLTILIPALTMGTFANEQEKQTIEYLITKPATTLELVLGKILGSTKFAFIAVLLTLPLPIMISRIGPLDWGAVFAGYFATLLLIIAFSSIGVAISSLFKNQISAFVLTVIVLVILMLIGSEFANINLPIGLASTLAIFSMTEHYYSMARGVLDFDDLVYFLSITLLGVSISYISVKNIRFGKLKNTISSGIIAVLAGAIVVLLLYLATDFVRERIDLTTTRKYTLSQTTKDILQNEGKTIIEVYASDGMPYEFEYRLNELTNTLEDYHKFAKGNLEVSFFNPKEYESELLQKGITPVEFRNYGEDQLQVQQGYLAVVVRNEDSSSEEILPFVDNVNTLEYDLTSRINKVKGAEKNVVGFASGNGERSIYEDYQFLSVIIGQDMEPQAVYLPSIEDESSPELEEDAILEDINLEDVELNNQQQPDLSGFGLLVIANPTTEYTQESKDNIKQFIENGGNVMYLVDMVDIDNTISEEGNTVVPSPERGKLLEEYGITVNPDMVYDAKSHMVINIPVGQGQRALPYPYKLLPVIGLAETADIPNIPTTLVTGWPSTVNKDENWSDLYITSPFAGVLSSPFNIDPRQTFSDENLSTHPMIVSREMENGSIIVVASSARIFDNQLLDGSRENILFASALFDYLSQGLGFSEIRAKNITSGRFVYITPAQKVAVKYVAPITSFLLLMGIGGSRYIRKRRLINRYA